MTDREILITVATRLSSLSDDFAKTSDAQAFFNAQIDDRVRYLEVNGAHISQDNANNVHILVGRVDVLEGFVIDHDAQVKQSAKIAGIVAGIIATIGVIVTIAISLYYWGRP